MSCSSDSVAFAENRRLLSKLLDYYKVSSGEELNAKDDSDYWKQMLWGMWAFNYHQWGTYMQCFDVTKPTLPVIQQWDGERRFFLDDKTGEVTHEKTYRKPEKSEPERTKYTIPKEGNLTSEGLACLPEGPMAANIRVTAYTTTGHGTAMLRQVQWGSALFGEVSLQPNDQIRIQVNAVFSTPSKAGEKGELQHIIVFRDDVTAMPWFTQSRHWEGNFDTAAGATPAIQKIEQAEAASLLLSSSKRVRGFKIKPDMSNYARITLTDGETFDVDALAEGGPNAQFYALHRQEASAVILQIVQLPEMGKPVAAKWRVMWRLGDRLTVGVCEYGGEGCKQQPTMYEYACEEA